MEKNMTTTTTTTTTGFRTLRMAGSEWYVEFNIVDGVSEITDAHHTDGPYSNMTMDRLNERLAEQLEDEALERDGREAILSQAVQYELLIQAKIAAESDAADHQIAHLV